MEAEPQHKDTGQRQSGGAMRPGSDEWERSAVQIRPSDVMSLRRVCPCVGQSGAPSFLPPFNPTTSTRRSWCGYAGATRNSCRHSSTWILRSNSCRIGTAGVLPNACTVRPTASRPIRHQDRLLQSPICVPHLPTHLFFACADSRLHRQSEPEFKRFARSTILSSLVRLLALTCQVSIEEAAPTVTASAA